MSTEANRIKTKLATLGDSLEDLEALLEPLLSQSLPETVVGLETIQQAKLQVVLPYLVYDLIFIYLKAKGIDPKTHPVVSELDRVRQYFNKITAAEEADKKPRVNLDKDAAGRFIKHAIAQSKYGRPPGDDAEPTPVNARAPVRVTSKMEARAQYERELKELGSDEDEGDDLQMFDGEEGEESEGDEVEEAPSTGKGKEKAIDVDEAMEDEPPVGTKRRRARMDPFAGYGDDEDSKKAKVSKNENGVAEPSEDQDTPPPKYTAESKARIETKLAKKKRKSRPITGQ